MEKSRNINGSVYPVSVLLGGHGTMHSHDTPKVLCLLSGT